MSRTEILMFIVSIISNNSQVPDGYQELVKVQCTKLVYNVPGTCYSCLEVLSDEEDLMSLVGSFTDVSLKYVVRDCDPNTGEVEDEVG